MFKVEEIRALTCDDIVNTFEFGTLDDALGKLLELEKAQRPADAYNDKGRLMSRNYPNMLKGCIDSREKARDLWKQGDSRWKHYDSAY